MKIKTKSNTSIIKKIQTVFKGFTIDKLDSYNFDKYGYNKYLSDFERAKSRFINSDYTILLDNKIVFSRLLLNKIETPELLGIIINGIYRSSSQNKTIKAELKVQNKLVLKPFADSDGGRGVLIIEKINDNYYINNANFTLEHIYNEIKDLDGYMVTPFLEQGEFTKSIYSETLNTIRILTMYDKEKDTVHIGATVLRVGTSESYPVDNWSAGGLSIKIDEKSGVLLDGKYKKKQINKSIYNHPDTGHLFYDKKIPNWTEIVNQIKDAALDLYFIPYIGWDIVLKDDGIVVLEGNNCSDVDLLQVHEPLLKNKKNKQFYLNNKIINKN